MTVYMLKDIRTGLYYRRRHGSWNQRHGSWGRRKRGLWGRWIEQKKASIWTSKIGPAASMRNMRRDKYYCEIIPFELKEIQ